MTPRLCLLPVSLALLLICGILNIGAAPREPWTTSRIHGSPEPPHPFRVERIYTNITFVNPLDAGTIPGTRRLVVVEQRGKLWTLENETASEADLFVDLKEFNKEIVESYGVTFHPKFADNKFVFVWAVLNSQGKPTREDGTQIIRFKMAEANPPRLDLKSGEVIFTWLSGGHNGGNIRFGPDGMLYISTGDAESPDPPDRRNTGQDISDLLSSILRIDVDRRDAGKAYGIPKDNPFLQTPNARGEVWAYGFRNPWRISFDPKRGDLWAADVGWELWEMIYRVERGGNYGWAITEGGKQEVKPHSPRGPTPILPPVIAHPHDEAASITGGDVYYGDRLPELKGSYIYGDWQFGTFWSLKTEGSRVIEHRELCRSSLMPAGFGIRHDGELIILDHTAGGLWRLDRNPHAGKTSDFPTKLSQTGFFADLSKQQPAPGVLPYEINAHRWADFAKSERWVGIPGANKITVARREWGVVGRGRLTFPEDTVLALTYSMEMEHGNPSSKRKVETQLMHYNGIGWGAYSYRWNDAGTDAELVGPKGDETPLAVKDPSAPGGVRHQNWKFYSRSECLRCHTIWNNFSPGFTGAQLKKDLLETLELRQDPQPLTDPYGDANDAQWKARSYLHVNCSVCHREAGGGAVRAFMNFDRSLKDSRLINEKPVLGDLGLPEGRVIAAGEPTRSVLLYRMTTAGRGHMPYLGGKLIDDAGILAVRDWIAGLKKEERVPENVSRQIAAEETWAKDLAGGNLDSLPKLLETSSGALRVAHAVIDGSLQGNIRAQAIERGAALADPLKRDLFERFLPPEKRRKVLGPNFAAESLLAAKGNATQGKEIFNAICASCHRAGDLGADFGPDLTKIAAKHNRAALLDQIIAPGKIIEPDWHLTTIATTDDESIAGFIAARTDKSITLKLPGGHRREIPSNEIKSLTNSRATLMPDGLLDNLSAQEAADLLEFLSNHR
jgi:putative heme-binding domain-containing protein